jgi:geranylgeranyl diphosphate synthase type II
MFNLDAYLETHRKAVDHWLDRHLPPETERPAALHKAMRYAVLAGGKRLRPILCLAACEAVGGRDDLALPAAAALEILHTYTLVHDDLPCMDDDDLRRGQPTCHKVFGEATALLAGDALLTLAFEWLGNPHNPRHETGVRLTLELARAAGSRGVVGGQVEDLEAEGAPPDPDRLAFIHRHKTGMLLRAAVRMGALAGGAHDRDLDAVSLYGDHVGLAFQIADDILNATSTPEQLGKPVGSDAAHGKLTYVAVYGLDQARHKAEEEVLKAKAALNPIAGGAPALAALADYAVHRTK